MKRMEQRCLEVTENTIETTQSLQWVRARKALGTCSSSAACMGRGSQAARELLRWRSSFPFWLLGWVGLQTPGWHWLVSCRAKINKPCYTFLGLLYRLIVWSRTPNRYGRFIFHNLFPSDVHLHMEMLWSSWSKSYKWGRQAFHDALILQGLHYAWW